MPDRITVLAVDDQPQNLRLLDAVLSPRGYRVVTASSGEQAMEKLGEAVPDLVLLDIVMPGIDGYEVCRRIRDNPATAFLPVVMITASGDQEKISAIRAGADDFVSKPFNPGELLARVASLARVKRYHDTINQQADELRQWNAELEPRVQAQVEDLERANRLRRFLSPQLVDLVIDSGDEDFLRSHRREIVVVFCDLRGFTPFAEIERARGGDGRPPRVPRGAGDADLRVRRNAGAVHRRRADGLLQRPVADRRRPGARDPDVGGHAGSRPGAGRAVAAGAATTWPWASGSPRASPRLGRIGFEGRFDYAAIGSVTNLAARLCDAARPWQVLASQRVFYAAEPVAAGEQIGELQLKGFSRPVRVFDVNEVDRTTERAGHRMTEQLIRDDLDDRPRVVRPGRLSSAEPVRGPAAADAVGLGRVEAGPGGRVGRRRAVGHRAPSRRRRLGHHPGVRGTAPLPAPAAAPAAAADDLRHLDADQPADHRVLPRSAARRDPEPCAGSADPDLGRRLLRPTAECRSSWSGHGCSPRSPRRSRTAPAATSSPTTPPRSSATSP